MTAPALSPISIIPLAHCPPALPPQLVAPSPKSISSSASSSGGGGGGGRAASASSRSETTASADGVGGGGDTTENEAENEDNDKGSKGSEKPAKDGKAEVWASFPSILALTS